MPHTVTLKKKTGRKPSGDIEFDAGTDFKGRFLQDIIQKYDMDIRETVSMHIMLIHPDAEPTTNDVVVYDSRTYVIKESLECVDDSNVRFQWQLAIR